jgi:isopenicillin-N epimerase
MNIRKISNLKDKFLLNPDIIFLNHGSFGATPVPVFEAYQKWQRQLEFQPVEFLGRRAPELLAESRAILAEYLGTSRDNIVYVTNVTTGINIVARSLDLKEGDEVLASDHEYGAMDRTWRFLSQKNKFKYVNQPISVPVTTKKKLVSEFLAGITPQTRAIYLSHITSPTAIIFPIKEICQYAREAGILTIIDGAHVPGQIPLNLDDLGADIYSGNLHKWLCAPKGVAFLYARPEIQDILEPLIVSWGWQSENPGLSRFVDYQEWTGTRDISAFLAVPDAIRFQRENNWVEIQKYCHELASQSVCRIAEISSIPPIYQNSDDWFRQMAVAPLPVQIDIESLKIRLYDDFKIEVPLVKWNDQKFIRFSFQAYNSESDSDALVQALQQFV